MAVENCGFIYNEIFPFWSKLEDKACLLYTSHVKAFVFIDSGFRSLFTLAAHSL